VIQNSFHFRRLPGTAKIPFRIAATTMQQIDFGNACIFSLLPEEAFTFTVTDADCFHTAFPFTVIRILAIPFFLAVTFPFWVTSATFALFERYFTEEFPFADALRTFF